MRFNRKLYKEAFRRGYRAGKKKQINEFNYSDLSPEEGEKLDWIGEIREAMPDLTDNFSNEGIDMAIETGCDDYNNIEEIKRALEMHTEYDSFEDLLEELGFTTLVLDNGHVLVRDK